MPSIKNNRNKYLLSFIGKSNLTEKIREKILEASEADAPVFIEGETGVGKGLVAKIIHQISSKKGKFVHVNCPSLPKELFESELFGYKKGAFTGATSDKRGFVEEAHEGTLFLDEIVELPPEVQSKLLIFAEEGKYYRLGEPRERQVDVRIIAATNQDIKEAIRERKFRQDLFFRLSVFEIYIPPLRERREDIECIMNHYSDLLRGREWEPRAKEYIITHPLPGNTRQIINIFTRLGVRKGPITFEEVKEELQRWEDLVSSADQSVYHLWKLIKEGENFWKVAWKPFMERNLKRDEIRALIKIAWENAGKSMKKTAQLLGISSPEYKKFLIYLKRYNLNPEK